MVDEDLWEDPLRRANKECALNRWLEERDELLAGLIPRSRTQRNSPALADACNSLLTEWEARTKSGELTDLSFARYPKAAQRLNASFGRDRRLSDLLFDDLVGFRGKLAEGKGLVHLANLLRAWPRRRHSLRV